MSITTEINRIKTAKQNLMTAINNKGGSLTENSKLEDFVTSVEEDILTGGSVEIPSETCFAYSYWSGGEIPLMVLDYMKTLTIIPTHFMEGCSVRGSLIIPSNITSISNYAFSDCKYLTSLSFSSNITSIGEYAFNNCSSLTGTLTIPSGVKIIKANSFYNCQKITNIEIPEGVTHIYYQAFRQCYGITSIVIPSTIIVVGDQTFITCKNVDSVTIKATTPPTLYDYNAFLELKSGWKMYVPAESVDAYKAASNWSHWADRIQAIPTENE